MAESREAISNLDIHDLTGPEMSALYTIKRQYEIRQPREVLWEKIKDDPALFKVWKYERDKIEFKVAKQNLKTEYISWVKRVINTPYTELPWLEKTIVAPWVIGLKGVNWIVRKINILVS